MQNKNKLFYIDMYCIHIAMWNGMPWLGAVMGVSLGIDLTRFGIHKKRNFYGSYDFYI